MSHSQADPIQQLLSRKPGLKAQQIADELGLDPSQVVTASLDGVKVTIGGQAAFVDYISPGQVNAQVPSNVGIGSQTVVMSNGSLSSSAAPITVNTVQPGLLAPASFTVGGKQYAAALFADGATYVLPPGAIPGAPARRARAGDIITLYGIGFGPVSTGIPAGQIVQTTNALAAPVHIFLGGAETAITYAGLAPKAVGLYQFNLVVPSIPPNDLAPLTFSIGGTSGTQTLYLAIE